MQNRTLTRLSARSLLCAIVVASGAAHSAELTNGISGGVTYSDNIRRVSENEDSETIGVIDLTVNLSHESRGLESVLIGNVGFRHYVDDTYDDDTVGNLFGSARFILAPDVFSWVVEDRFGTLQRNPYAAQTPDNIENINNFGTGPDFSLRLGNVTSLDLSARYRYNWFEESPAENENVGGEVRLIRALSSRRSISLSYRADTIDYKDQDIGQDFDRAFAAIGIQSEMSRGTLTLDAGMNEIDIDGEKSDGFYGMFRLTRELTSRSRLSILYDQRFSEAGDIFRIFQDPGRQQPGDDILDIPGVGSPFEARRFQVGLTQDRQRGGWYVRAYTIDEDYIDSTVLDRTRLGFAAGLNRNLGANWNGSLSARYEDLDLAVDQTDYSEVYAQAGLSRRLSRSLFLTFDYQLATRDSDAPNGDFVENRIGVAIRYASIRE